MTDNQDPTNKAESDSTKEPTAAQDEQAPQSATGEQAQPEPQEEESVEASEVAASEEAEPAKTVPDGKADFNTLPITEGYVADLLKELGEVAQDCGLQSLAREVFNERLPALARGKITLVVLGEFNHGKSSVVNALLGDDVLPVGITPTTAVITHLVYGAEAKVTIKPPHDGEPYEIKYEEMERAVRESGDEGEEPEYVEISYPNKVLGNSLVLVDTPGVNDISRQKVEITYGYVPRADVILYVLDATQVLKKSEVTFIRDRLLKANRDRIIFVLNKIDALSPEDLIEVERYARDRLEAIIGPVELFSFSARKALMAQKNGEALPESFEKFQHALLGFLNEQRAYIILDSALSGGQRMGGMLLQNLAIKRQGYRMEKAELDRRIAAVRTKLKESRRLIAENVERIDERIIGIAATAKHNLRVFSGQFLEQLPIQIERAEARDVKRYLPAFIQDTFKAWLEQEGQEMAKNLEALAEEVIQITNESLKDAVESYRQEFGISGELDLEVDTIAYDVGVFALGAFGLSVLLFTNVLIGGLLTLAAPVLAFVLRDKVSDQIKERAREEGVKAVELATDKIEAELLRVIHDYGDRLKQFVETAGDRLYRQVEEALGQVQLETAGDADREVLLKQIEGKLESVQRIVKVITVSREKLASHAAKMGFN